MAFTAGTTEIKIRNIDTIDIDNGIVQLAPTGDELLDGVSVAPSAGSTVKVASGKDRITSEKVIVSFDIVEIAVVDLVSLLACKGTVTSLSITGFNGAQGLFLSGILQVYTDVKTNGLISYKCSMEVNADDIDSELTVS